MRPHVLYITPMFGYPAFGGPRLRTYNTLKALAMCADVSLFLTEQPDTVDRASTRAHLLSFCRDVVFPPAPPEATGLRSLVRRAVPAPARAALRRLRPVVESADAADHSPERDPAVRAALLEWIAAHRPDVIWLGFGGISYDLVGLKQATGLPLVLETECVWSRFILREAPYAPDTDRRAAIMRAGQAKAAEERRGAGQVDVTTAVSDVDAEYFRGLEPAGDARDRVMLLANVIDVDSYALPVPPPRAPVQQPALLFAGTLSRGTANIDGVRWLLDEVMPLVWQVRPGVHLYLVGRNPAPAVLAYRGPRVHVTGEVPSIVPYMHASTAALVPLRWESGTRFKILEAFACRTPVVSTTLGAEGLSVETERHLLLADSPDAFAAAVLRLLDDPALGPRLTEPAYGLVRAEYDVRSAARQIDAVLQRLGFEAGAHV